MLLGQDVEAARKAVGELLAMKRQPFNYAWAGRYSKPPKIVAPASDIFEDFEQKTAGIREKVAATEAGLRETLVEKLKKIEEGNLKAEQELAVRRTIEMLTLDSFQGLNGFVLFYIDSNLKDESLEAVMHYWREAHAAVAAARKEQLAAFEAIRPKLDEARRTHVEQKDWEAAFCVLETSTTPPRFFEPIRVKTGGSSSYDHWPWDGTVVDVRDGFLVVLNVHKHEELMTRDRVRVGQEKFPPIVGTRFSGDVTPPSFPVTNKTELKPGRLVLLQEHNRWTIVEVKQSGTNDVFIHYLNHSDTWDKSVSRAELRIATPE